ncbi:hypothetical protein NEOLEDRAFT_1132095 [Neolentinus lepideus HHB14362 ss-1]|uniref:Uncharacterized protein n=1 Tax=Neolentinus lepideus HHB14362 ss-1 TaxID=1314782 RepID=A0A165TF17_9AGAM|nr:hypothetical protein NEOLEDRAFT_1132095 [Neolentinus lepideus HHB14362 ss-1]
MNSVVSRSICRRFRECAQLQHVEVFPAKRSILHSRLLSQYPDIAHHLFRQSPRSTAPRISYKAFHSKAPASIHASRSVRKDNHDDHDAWQAIIEGLTDSWTEENEWKTLALMGPDPTPAAYFAKVIRNMLHFLLYIRTVDLQDFRTADVEPGSDIARGREVLVTMAGAAYRWMHAAMAHPAAAEKGLHDDAELVESLVHMAKNQRIIADYKRGELPPGWSWMHVSDLLVMSLNIACQNMSVYVKDVLNCAPDPDN